MMSLKLCSMTMEDLTKCGETNFPQKFGLIHQINLGCNKRRASIIITITSYTLSPAIVSCWWLRHLRKVLMNKFCFHFYLFHPLQFFFFFLAHFRHNFHLLILTRCHTLSKCFCCKSLSISLSANFRWTQSKPDTLEWSQIFIRCSF